MKSTAPSWIMRERGVSLIELMIAMVISLILLGGVIQIFLSSKQTYNMQEGVARIQENGRYGIDYVARYVHMAGFQGCTNVNLLRPNIISKTVPGGYLTELQKVINGVDSAAAVNSYGAKLGSDVLIIHSGSASTVRLSGNLASDNANIQVDSNPDNYQAGDVLFITDCENSDVFTATNVSSNASPTIAHANSSNTTNRLSKPYQNDAMILRLQSSSFYVRDTGNTNTNGAAIFGLYQRNEFNNAETLMVDGVEDFQVLYGVNTNNDNNKTPDIYQTASAVTNWERVVSVRIFLLLNSVDNVLGQVQPYTFMGNVVANPGDRMLRREFTATIGVRNRSL